MFSLVFHPRRAGALLTFLLTFLLGATVFAPRPLSAQSVSAPAKEPAQIDLSPFFDRWNLTIKGQQYRDTCAVFTVTAALEFGMSKRIDEGVALSEEYLNWAANQTGGDDHDGASFTQLQNGYGKWGIAGEDDMPYLSKFNPANEPSPGALEHARPAWQLKPKWNWIVRQSPNPLTTAHIAAAKRVLQRGWPVCAEGQHCMLLVAFFDDWEGGGTFLARDYARKSYETLTYADVQRRFYSLMSVEFAPPAPAPKPN